MFWLYSFPSANSTQNYPAPPTPIFSSVSLNKRREMKIKKPYKAISQKKVHKKHGVHFVLANYSSTWGMPWRVVDALLEKTDFAFPRRY